MCKTFWWRTHHLGSYCTFAFVTYVRCRCPKVYLVLTGSTTDANHSGNVRFYVGTRANVFTSATRLSFTQIRTVRCCMRSQQECDQKKTMTTTYTVAVTIYNSVTTVLTREATELAEFGVMHRLSCKEIPGGLLYCMYIASISCLWLLRYRPILQRFSTTSQMENTSFPRNVSWVCWLVADIQLFLCEVVWFF